MFVFPMIVEIDVRTGKGDESVEKEIDETVDILEPLVAEFCDRKGYEWIDVEAHCDGTSVVLSSDSILNI
jgi:hypothetical protein